MATYVDLLNQWGLDGQEEYQDVMAAVREAAAADTPPEQRRRQTLALATWAVTKAWEALPPRLRAQAREMALEVLNKVLTSVGQALAPLEQVTDVVGDVPLLGWVVDLLDFVVGIFTQTSEMVISARQDASETDRNWMRWLTVYDGVTSSPVVSGVRVQNYMHYYTPNQQINGKRWRYEPSLIPTGNHLYGDTGPAALWGTGNLTPSGYNAGNDVPGVPGRPFKNCPSNPDGPTPTSSYRDDPDSPCDPYPNTGENPTSYITVSALLYPWWTPQAVPEPLPILKTERSGNFTMDPNGPLLAAQGNLLNLWHYNLRASGSHVRTIKQAMGEFVYGQLAENGWKAYALVHTSPGGSRPASTSVNQNAAKATIDQAFDPQVEADLEGTKEVRFYTQDNQFFSYHNRADAGDWGFPGPDNFGYGQIAVSLAQWNLVEIMTSAFFSARKRFLTPHFCRMIVEESFEIAPGQRLTLDDVDEEARSTVEALAEAPDVYHVDLEALDEEMDAGGGKFNLPEVDPPLRKPLGLEGAASGKKKTKQKSSSVLLPLGLVAVAAAGGAGLWWYRKQPKKKRKTMAMKKQTKNLLIGAGVVTGVALAGYAGYQLTKPKPKKKKKKKDEVEVTVDPGKLAEAIMWQEVQDVMADAWANAGRPEGSPPVWFQLAALGATVVDPAVEWPDTAGKSEIWHGQFATPEQKKVFNRAYALAKDVTTIEVIPQNGGGGVPTEAEFLG